MPCLTYDELKSESLSEAELRGFMMRHRQKHCDEIFEWAPLAWKLIDVEAWRRAQEQDLRL
jgi:hypothetical protein